MSERGREKSKFTSKFILHKKMHAVRYKFQSLIYNSTFSLTQKSKAYSPDEHALQEKEEKKKRKKKRKK